MKTKFLPCIAIFAMTSFSLCAQTTTNTSASCKEAEQTQEEAQQQQEIAAAHQ